MWPGPVDRWDDGNRIRIKLYGGALSSATADAVLSGANTLAIEGETDWEIIQARTCELVAPNEYELSGFLRGQLGTAHAMGAPHPVGARIVKLDGRLSRCAIAAHEWQSPLTFTAPPARGLLSDARAASLDIVLPHAAVRPWAPAHLRAKRAPNDDVTMTWLRCARFGDDGWGAGEPPVGETQERYRLEILDGAAVKRSVETFSPAYVYSSANQIADFGGLPGSLRFRVAQLADNGAAGLNKELTITL